VDGGWQQEFEKVLPLLGHRNWVLVTDKAFPLQNASGITYINTGGQLIPVLVHVLASIRASAHVKPQLFTDTELNFLSPRMVPGITGFRDSLLRVMKSETVQTIPHDSVFTRMQEAAGLFKIVVLKTEATVPYSSVFIRLDCDYWDEAREKELRASMQKQ
jgi:D-ribose pyranose/furanose isomerase RbsD